MFIKVIILLFCAKTLMFYRTSRCVKPNEEFSLCGWRCPATCVNLRLFASDRCPSIWDCRVGCRCTAGFVRDEYSKACVLVQDCPDTPVCPPGEVMGTNLQCIRRRHLISINESHMDYYSVP
ncbi:IgGFc-binding protein-like [Spodoptera frugiperda]|uniref:IgGFc-binding protein-like n=1 Tax=Spodoptera frugiperda TaxID=7108 RepID=A0A9R0D108_SPOFR|nr:IgGFc-binding protein-like [Spodoptera frugiperda]